MAQEPGKPVTDPSHHGSRRPPPPTAQGRQRQGADEHGAAHRLALTGRHATDDARLSGYPAAAAGSAPTLPAGGPLEGIGQRAGSRGRHRPERDEPRQRRTRIRRPRRTHPHPARRHALHIGGYTTGAKPARRIPHLLPGAASTAIVPTGPISPISVIYVTTGV